MAESSDTSSQEREEEPTEKRLREAREKGQAARSRELNTTVMLLTASAVMLTLGSQVGSQLLELVQAQLNIERAHVFDIRAPLRQFSQTALTALAIVAPLLLIFVVASFAGPLLIGGWSFSLKAIKPQASRMSIMKGLTRMFGLQALVELIKSLAKFGLLALVAWFLFEALQRRYIELGQLALFPSVITAADLMGTVFTSLSATLILVALIDVPYQKWNHIKQLKMSRQEVKEESKETNGNPEVKGKIRQMQQEAANRKMLIDVKTSDVIIVNPTHFSVALKYDTEGSGAPKVTARGVDHMALRIREVGKAHDVPIFQAPLLARVIYHQVKVNDEIPHELYLAVAQVLAYVFTLRQYKAGNAEQPQLPTNLSIPAKFRNR
ncbi:flagellar biosynthesis protein FlhB [Chromatiales bacterium (ex Bugula neritina AB1)]|nr:flagellar biosynthesis protein FlhB [Chromatiales bacterium (ex Bugula neritina AB1)]